MGGLRKYVQEVLVVIATPFPQPAPWRCFLSISIDLPCGHLGGFLEEDPPYAVSPFMTMAPRTAHTQTSPHPALGNSL